MLKVSVSGRYKTINDVAEVLEKSINPYIEFSKLGRLCIGYDVLAVRLSLVDKDLRERLSDNILRPFILEKMGKINI